MTLEEARIQPVYAKNDDLLTVSRRVVAAGSSCGNQSQQEGSRAGYATGPDHCLPPMYPKLRS
jgi:hypothetical protein